MKNNDLQKTTQKTKDRATRTQLKHGVNSGAPEWSVVLHVAPVKLALIHICIIALIHICIIALINRLTYKECHAEMIF